MKTIQDILMLTTQHLQKRKMVHARRQAEELICHALKISRMQVYTEFDRPITEAELDTCRHYLQRRSTYEPLAYIHGTIEFMGCDIDVTSDVLIPRQETEILVDKIIRSLSSLNFERKVLWDICCGSGCMGIAIKKRFPMLHVILSDISEKALAVAKKNAEKNNVEIEFRHGDLLAPFAGQKTDFFVSNPPYIAAQEHSKLEPDVRNFEPSLALIGGETGLEFYRRLAQELPLHLRTPSKAWLEMGTGQGKAIQELFSSFSCRVESDWAGHDRFFSLEIE